MKTVGLSVVAIVSMILSCASLALTQDQDLEGSKDHPLLSRYPGSFIREYVHREFDEFDLVLGKAASDKFEKTQHLEGRVTYIQYASPAGRSELEVFRNYQAALQKAGLQTLFTCVHEQCGDGAQLPQYPQTQNASWGGVGVRYLAGRLSRPEGDAYISLLVDSGSWFGTAGPGAQLFIIEMKPMESGLITVNAASLASDITRTGHASVYGILFDSGKADVKPESDAALKEIAKLLQQDPTLKLYVVGHTDNQGTLEMNMDLSRRRADAVVKELTTKHGIATTQLRSYGDGPYAPVASNETEDGRAKNRRVELVKQ